MYAVFGARFVNNLVNNEYGVELLVIVYKHFVPSATTTMLN